MKLLGLVVFAFALGSAGASAADDASALLAKHRAFVGWQEGDGTFKSWRATGPVIHEVRRGAIYRDTIGALPLQRDDGFDGKGTWQSDYNGNTVRLHEDNERFAISANALSDEATAALPGTLRGTHAVDAATYPVVRVQPKGGFPIDLYIDPETGAYKRAVIDPDGRFATTVGIESYLDVSGKKVLASFKVGAQTYTFDKIEPNVTIADSEFEPPKTRQSWTFADGDAIPMEILSLSTTQGVVGKSVRLRASVNGQEGTFLLDSGASGIFLSGPFARRAGLEAIARTGFRGVNGVAETSHYTMIKEIAFGKSVLRNTVAVFADNNVLSDTDDGLMGYDMLANAIVDVDLDAKLIHFYDPVKTQPSVGHRAFAFAVDLSERVPRIPVTINNQVQLSPIFDTGDADEVLLSQYILRSGTYVPQIISHTFIGGVDGTSPEPIPCARILLLSIGPYRYTGVPVCFGTEKAFGKRDGLIGFDFLEHFNWTFDYPDGVLVLTPNGVR